MQKIGEELRAAREHRELTMEEVVGITKIEAKFLEALEEGNFDILPDPYIKAFLRAYAAAVGANVTTIMREYEELRQKPRSEQISEYTPSTEPVKSKEPPAFKKFDMPVSIPKVDVQKIWSEHRNLILSVIGGLAVIVILVIVITSQPKSYEVISKKAADEPVADTKNLDFAVTALQPLYLMVSMDGGDSLDYNLAGDEVQHFQADDSIWILTSNAGACEIALNGDKLDKPGEKEFAAHFTVDKSGVHNVKTYKSVVLPQ
jgi:transcriptional regulator with XRE-family HTH domain